MSINIDGVILVHQPCLRKIIQYSMFSPPVDNNSHCGSKNLGRGFVTIFLLTDVNHFVSCWLLNFIHWPWFVNFWDVLVYFIVFLQVLSDFLLFVFFTGLCLREISWQLWFMMHTFLFLEGQICFLFGSGFFSHIN